jgi:hypothetical protein
MSLAVSIFSKMIGDVRKKHLGEASSSFDVSLKNQCLQWVFYNHFAMVQKNSNQRGFYIIFQRHLFLHHGK